MKELWKRPVVKIIAVVLAIVLAVALWKGIRFLKYRKQEPFKMSFDAATEELIFSPSFSFALTGHLEETTSSSGYAYPPFLEFAGETEGSYRFHVTRQSTIQFLTIDYYDKWEKENKSALLLMRYDSGASLVEAMERPKPGDPWDAFLWTDMIELPPAPTTDDPLSTPTEVSPSPTATGLPIIGPDDPFPFGNYDRGPFEEMAKTNERVELPLPTSALFGLEGADAALYEAAVADIYNLAVPEAFSGDDLYLPSLSVIGSYQNEDGETCYVCVYRRYCYDYLAYGLADPDRPQYFPAFDYMPVRITLAEQEGGTLVCSDFLWGQLNGFSGSLEKRGEVLADMLAGPSPELQEKIKEYVRLMQQDPVNGDAMVHGKIPAPDNYRNLTTPDPYELLDIYLGYFFRAEGDK